MNLKSTVSRILGYPAAPRGTLLGVDIVPVDNQVHDPFLLYSGTEQTLAVVTALGTNRTVTIPGGVIFPVLVRKVTPVDGVFRVVLPK